MVMITRKCMIIKRINRLLLYDNSVYWDPMLIPPRKNYPPMDYTAAKPRLVEDVTIRDIQRFFVNYINNDNLGQIANAHLATADMSDKGAMDGRCILLAQLHSEAVGKKENELSSCGRKLIIVIYHRFPKIWQACYSF